MQLLSQRRPSEQRMGDDGSNQIFRVADICLGDPCRQGFAGRTNFLSEGLPPPFGASLLPVPSVVYYTPERNDEDYATRAQESPKSSKQTLWSAPECSIKRQVKGGMVGNWICVNFSCLSTEETNKFLSGLRDTCVAIGMDFNLDPAVTIHCKCAVPSVVESTLLYVLELLTKHAVMDKSSRLLIVIGPDFRTCDGKVGEMCRKLGVVYQCCLPEHARASSIQYLNNAACEIKAKVLEKVGENGEAMEICDLDKVVGEDCVGKDQVSKEFIVMDGIGEDGDKLGEDDESSEICGWDEDLPLDGLDSELEGYNDTLDSSDLEMESLDSSDSEMGEYVDSEKQSEIVNDDSEQFDEAQEDEGYHEKTQQAETFEQINGPHEQMRKGSAGHVTNKNFLCCNPPQEELEAMQMERHSEKLPLPMAVSFMKRNYADYDGMQIQRGIVIDWACVNFSCLYLRVNSFFDKLAYVCDAMGLHFNCVPVKAFHVKSALPNNIMKTFRGVRKSILELFSRIKMKGEPIGLLLVILPESREFDAKIEEACKNLRVVYQCCLPSDIYKPTRQYLKRTTREIRSKVVERDTFIPFVSEGPTIILGADTSCDSVASVVTSVDWQEFGKYRVVVEPNNGPVIQQLFNEHGGMIGNLLGPVCRKIKRDCRIIFFRHGINEEHITQVCCQEVAAIKQACAHLKIGFEPSVTFVVVGGNKEEDSSNHDKHDFLCDHGFVEGTKPARYRVVHDENNLTLQDLDSIIIKLCLLRNHAVYPNISMVPPAYAAWFAASRR